MPVLPISGLPRMPPSAATPVLALIGSEVISSLLWQAAKQPPAWGVFDLSGNQLLFPDSVVEFSRRADSEAARYPIQGDGTSPTSFANYNKVIFPYEVQLRFSKAGSTSDRAAFLNSIDALLLSVQLVSVYTPEVVYPNLNLLRSEVVRRGAKGAYFLTEVDCYFDQIQQTTPQYTTTALQLPNATSPAAQPTSNVGTVQPTAPTSQVQQDGTAAMASVPAPLF